MVTLELGRLVEMWKTVKREIKRKKSKKLLSDKLLHNNGSSARHFHV